MAIGGFGYYIESQFVFLLGIGHTSSSIHMGWWAHDLSFDCQMGVNAAFIVFLAQGSHLGMVWHKTCKV